MEGSKPNQNKAKPFKTQYSSDGEEKKNHLPARSRCWIMLFNTWHLWQNSCNISKQAAVPAEHSEEIPLRQFLSFSPQWTVPGCSRREGRSSPGTRSLGTFTLAPTCALPRLSHIVWLQLMQWPHWEFSQVKQEAFTSLCSSFRRNIAWVSFYLSKLNTQRLYKNLICNFLTAFFPLVCRPQTSASLRALNETWHHSVEKQDNRHHCG